MNSSELEKATTSGHRIFGDFTDVPEYSLPLISGLEIPRHGFWGTLLLGFHAWDRELFSEQWGSSASSQHSMNRVGGVLGFLLPGILDHIRYPSQKECGHNVLPPITISRQGSSPNRQAKEARAWPGTSQLLCLLAVRESGTPRSLLSPFPFTFSWSLISEQDLYCGSFWSGKSLNVPKCTSRAEVSAQPLWETPRDSHGECTHSHIYTLPPSHTHSHTLVHTVTHTFAHHRLAHTQGGRVLLVALA